MEEDMGERRCMCSDMRQNMTTQSTSLSIFNTYIVASLRHAFSMRALSPPSAMHPHCAFSPPKPLHAPFLSLSLRPAHVADGVDGLLDGTHALSSAGEEDRGDVLQHPEALAQHRTGRVRL